MPTWVRNLGFKLQPNDSKAWGIESLLGNQEVPRGTWSINSHIPERLRKWVVAIRVMNLEQSSPFHFLGLSLPSPPLPSLSLLLDNKVSCHLKDMKHKPGLGVTCPQQSHRKKKKKLETMHSQKKKNCFLGCSGHMQRQKQWDSPAKGAIWSCWSANLRSWENRLSESQQNNTK